MLSNGIFLIAVLARLDQPLRLAESCGRDEHDNLLFWCWVKKPNEFGGAAAFSSVEKGGPPHRSKKEGL